MHKRFQIEDLIVQDASGVVFRALDTETGKAVSLRRFFPFGAGGGGLSPDEQTAYDIAVRRLSRLSHPSLRSIIAGGCDPIDGMPFIVTEWVTGETLEAERDQSGMSAETVTVLVTQALEVCELLSHVLAEEAVWVETDMQTIIVGSPESDRGFTFWISPLKWLGGSNESKGLESIVALTEEAMGWKGQIVNDQAGRGLGGWLKWLRNTATTTSLHEARESLAASVGANPPPPAENLVAIAAHPQINPSSSKTPLVLALGLGLIIGLLTGGWIMFRNSSPDTPPVSSTPVATSHAERVNLRAAELSAHATQTQQKESAVLAGQKAAAEQRGGVISWDDHELLVAMKGKPVIVEGVVQDNAQSGSGKTVYLLFSSEENRDATRAGMRIDSEMTDSMIAKLEPFTGKNVRISGTVALQKVSGLNRPDIMINDISAVKVIE